jgi:NAD(P)-dependent dehydrogenase (short-subunit alcohol dehydrogenase family)
MAAAVHLPYLAPYSAAKAGVSAMADCMRIELDGTGTAVGVAYLGFIDTDMTRRGMEHPAARRLPMTRPLPVELAGRAMVHGIERRSRWIVLPAAARSALIGPGPAQRAAEAVARRVLRNDR